MKSLYEKEEAPTGRKLLVYGLIFALSGLIWVSLGMAWVLCFEATTFGGWLPFVILGLGPALGTVLTVAIVLAADRTKTD